MSGDRISSITTWGRGAWNWTVETADEVVDEVGEVASSVGDAIAENAAEALAAYVFRKMPLLGLLFVAPGCERCSGGEQEDPVFGANYNPEHGNIFADVNVENNPDFQTCMTMPEEMRFVQLTDTNANPFSPRLIWNGNNYAVAWQEVRSGTGSGDYEDIHFMRFDSSGDLIGQPLQLTHNRGADGIGPASLAWTGSEYGVTWTDYENGNIYIYLGRISADGEMISDSPIRVTSRGVSSSAHAFVWTGREYGLTWESRGEVYFKRFSQEGNSLSREVRVTFRIGRSDNSSLVWTGNEYGVVWEDNRGHALRPEIYFTSISRSGVPRRQDIQISDADYSWSCDPLLVWTGEEYGVIWSDQRHGGRWESYFNYFTGVGQRLSEDVRIATSKTDSREGDSYAPSIAWTGEEYGIAWQDSRNMIPHEIYFSRFSETGTGIGTELRITNDISNAHGRPSYDPSLVWTGQEYGLCWADTFGDNPRFSQLYFTRIICSN